MGQGRHILRSISDPVYPQPKLSRRRYGSVS